MEKKMYWGYNRMYFRGKPFGRAFKSDSGSSALSVKRKVMKSNAIWNKKMGSRRGYEVKLEKVMPVTKRKRSVRRSMGLWDYL